MFSILGWVGAIGLLVTYFLNVFKILSASDKAFKYLNMISSAFLAVNAYSIKAYPFIIINVLWFFVSLFALFTHKAQDSGQ